jgi:hypothetical protein
MTVTGVWQVYAATSDGQHDELSERLVCVQWSLVCLHGPSARHKHSAPLSVGFI